MITIDNVTMNGGGVACVYLEYVSPLPFPAKGQLFKGNRDLLLIDIVNDSMLML